MLSLGLATKRGTKSAIEHQPSNLLLTNKSCICCLTQKTQFEAFSFWMDLIG